MGRRSRNLVIAIIAFPLCHGLISSCNAQSKTPQTGKDTIRPFKVKVPEKDLVDLRRRIAATRWPDKETVADQSQGVQLARLQKLVRYWGTDYDWRKAEAKLNTLPQFMTNIDVTSSVR